MRRTNFKSLRLASSSTSDNSPINPQRRYFLRTAVFGCVWCFAAGRAGAAENNKQGGIHWSYSGDTGPMHWGNLQPDFKVCQLGPEQTPVNLADAIKGEASPAVIDYRPLPLQIVNNGHTIQVNADPGSSIAIGSAKYDLLQFHFHHPSEHLLAGKAFDLECHLVHRSSEGALAVIGVFVKPGARNAALAPVFDNMPAKAGPEINALATVDLSALLPQSRAFFRYMGSLTTPPCSEGLTWTIFKEPIEASSEQIKKFASLYQNNARPLQKKNRRFLIETGL